MTSVPPTPEPDVKDWTWVLDAVCPECGYDAGSVRRDDLGDRIIASTSRWEAVLRRPDVAVRPAPVTWSVLEYGCHVRDVHALFGERGRLIQNEDDPGFANWDQDATAIAERYWAADPAQVAARIRFQAARSAAAFGGLSSGQWSRTGRRSNGSVFTMESLGRYYLHDVEHHLRDVGA